MSQTILIKRTATTGNTYIQAPSFAAGELMMNTTDRLMWGMGSTVAFKILTENNSIKDLLDIDSLMVPGAGDVLRYSAGKWTADNTLTTLTTSKADLAGSSAQDFAVKNLSVTGSIVPTVADFYDLGSAAFPFRDLYLGPQSLYINGQQVISNTADTMNFHADPNQNIRIQTDGVGDVELAPIGTGNIALKGTVEILAGKNIITSDGLALNFSQGSNFDGNVNAFALLENGIPIADRYASVSGSSIQNFSVSTLNASSTVTAAAFSGNGALVTNVDALTLNGISGSELMPLYRSFSNLSSFDVVGQTYIFSREDTLFPGGTLPAGASNALGIISLHTKAGNYSTQLALSTNTNDAFIRSDNNTGIFGDWIKLYSEGNFGKTEIDALAINAGQVDGIEGANITTLTGTQIITGAKTFSTTLTGTIANFSGDVSVGGNLNVTGGVTTVNTTELQVQDKNIELGVVTTPTDASAEGGGITLLGTTNKTITWLSSKAAWDFNQNISVTSATPTVTLYDTNLADSNASLNVSSGNLNIWSPALVGAGNIVFGGYGNTNLTGDLLVKQNSTLYKVYHEGNLDPANLDAITLDGLDSTQFIRSDADDQKTGKLFMDDHLVVTQPIIGRDYGNELWMVDKIGNYVPSANIINNTACFRKGDSYAYFNDGTPAVFEVTGLSIAATTAVTSRRIVVFPHQGFTTDLKIEVQKADGLWAIVYNQTTSFTSSKWEFYELTGLVYPTDWNIKGIRWTFSNYGAVNRYIGQLGITNVRDHQTFEYLGREGGSFYQSIYGRLGTTATIDLNPGNGFITAASFVGGGGNLTGVNAALLDSLDSTQFLRSDIASSKSGNLIMTDGDIQFATALTGFTNPNGNDLLRTSTADAGNASVIGNTAGTTYIDSLSNPVVRVGVAAPEIIYHTGNLTKAVVDGLGVDAETLDSLDSTQFLRADISDTMSGSLTVTGTITEGTTLLSNKYLGIGATAANANLLDNLDSTQFLRSDISGTLSGNLTTTGNVIIGGYSGAIKFAGIGLNTVYLHGDGGSGDDICSISKVGISNYTFRHFGNLTTSGTITEAGVALGSKYLGINATADNAALLDNLDSTQFLRSDVDTTLSGNLTIDTTSDIKLAAKGSANPLFRLYEGIVAKADLRWSAAGYIFMDNLETTEQFRLGSGLKYSPDNGVTIHDVYHAGNLTTSIINALNVNATTLDNLDSTQFLRSDIASINTGGLSINASIDNQTSIFEIREVRGSTSGSGSNLFKIGESGDAGIMSLGYYGLSDLKSRIDFNGGSSNTNPSISFRGTDGSEQIRFRSGLSSFLLNSNFGLGTANPTTSLDVIGDIKTNSSYFINTKQILENGSYLRLLPDPNTAIDIGLQKMIIGTGAAPSDLTVMGHTGVYGNVGIGTVTPAAKLDIQDTWNDALTVFTGVSMNITNTASDISSTLLDFKVNTNSRMSLSPKGVLTLDDSDELNQRAAGLKIISSDRNVLLKAGADGGHATGLTGPTFYQTYKDGSALVLGSSSGNGTVSYFRIESEGVADAVALRRTTNPQTFNIYNTYTDAANYERGHIKWDANVLSMGTESLGTGITRNIALMGGNVGIGTTTPAEKLDIAGNIKTSGHYAFSNNATIETYSTSGVTVANAGYSTVTLGINSGVQMRSTGLLGWTSGESHLTPDLTIYRGAADILEQRRGANPQTFNIYNTYTDTSNYERGYVKWDTNELRIGTTYLGTGVRRNLRLGNTGIDGGNTILGCGNFAGSAIQLAPSGTASFNVKYREFSPYNDNESVLGTTTKRFKELHLANNLSIGDSKTGTQSATLATVTQTAVATFDATLYLSGKFVIQSKDTVTGEVQVTEILVVHDGVSASKTEYGTIHTGASPLASFDVDINTGFVRILATAVSANSTDYKVQETLIKA